MYNKGTHYSCGCWKGGDHSTHPEKCPVHGKPWKGKYDPEGRKVAENTTIVFQCG